MTNHNPKRPKPLRLPFEKRKGDGDWGHWIYSHKVGLLSTVVVFLFGAICFLSYKIVINTESTNMVAIEFEKEQEKVPEKLPDEEKVKKLEAIEKMMMEELSKPQNRISNQGGKLNSALRDSKNTNAKEIYDEMERVTRELEAGKVNHDKGLGEIRDKKSQQKQQNEQQQRTNSDNRAKEGDQNRSEKVKGDVFVSYELEGRTHVYLHIPAYQCQYGGVVVVAITVNRNGKVLSANIDKATSTSDDCISKMAVQSAMISTFSASNSAPEKQKGTITYRFVPQ